MKRKMALLEVYNTRSDIWMEVVQVYFVHEANQHSTTTERGKRLTAFSQSLESCFWLCSFGSHERVWRWWGQLAVIGGCLILASSGPKFIEFLSGNSIWGSVVMSPGLQYEEFKWQTNYMVSGGQNLITFNQNVNDCMNEEEEAGGKWGMNLVTKFRLTWLFDLQTQTRACTNISACFIFSLPWQMYSGAHSVILLQDH